MEISDKLKNFLEDPKIQDLIDNNKWKDLYKKITPQINPN